MYHNVVIRKMWVLLLVWVVILWAFTTTHARGADDVDVSTALALATAKHRAKTEGRSTVVLAPGQYRASDGSVVEFRRGQWYTVTTTSQAQPMVSLPQVTNGCGCSANYNCGASFCKGKNGLNASGCPQSCPVKQGK